VAVTNGISVPVSNGEGGKSASRACAYCAMSAGPDACAYCTARTINISQLTNEDTISFCPTEISINI
jgi:hypothetical protein